MQSGSVVCTYMCDNRNSFECIQFQNTQLLLAHHILKKNKFLELTPLTSYSHHNPDNQILKINMALPRWELDYTHEIQNIQPNEPEKPNRRFTLNTGDEGSDDESLDAVDEKFNPLDTCHRLQRTVRRRWDSYQRNRYDKSKHYIIWKDKEHPNWDSYDTDSEDEDAPKKNVSSGRTSLPDRLMTCLFRGFFSHQL